MAEPARLAGPLHYEGLQEPLADGAGASPCVHGHGPADGCGDAAHSFLVERLEPGDTVLTIGAGDVYRLGERLLEDLEEREGKA